VSHLHARAGRGVKLADLATPALVVDAAALEANLRAMSAALPGPRLRPHVKAHKCTALAKRQAALGHATFTCATIREVEGMAAAGLGADLLLANEVLDARRLGALHARVTVAVDSEATLAAAAAGGVREVLVDVNVGLPRCGCAPEDAGRLADAARRRGLTVRGVMGYEGHLMLAPDQADRAKRTAEAMALLARAHTDVGGDVVSAGGTGTYDLNDVATEIQAGSYALMDTAYSSEHDLPFRPSLAIIASVISVNASDGFAVADCGLKALGMDHGGPEIGGHTVWFCSDEHVTFSPADVGSLPTVGDRVVVRPAHVDPTVAYHETLHVADGPGLDADVMERWPVDLRGW
jgi:D-serine deaminase-like pyridoxal phosphate-dependent protein